MKENKTIAKYFKIYSILFIATIVYVIGINIFLSPIDLYAIGVVGFAHELAVIIEFMVKNDYTGIIILMINIPLMIWAITSLENHLY